MSLKESIALKAHQVAKMLIRRNEMQAGIYQPTEFDLLFVPRPIEEEIAALDLEIAEAMRLEAAISAFGTEKYAHRLLAAGDDIGLTSV